MISSFRISQEVNVQTVLWAVAGAMVRTGEATIKVARWLRSQAPAIVEAVRVLAITMALFAGLVAVVAVAVLFWVAIVQVVACLAVAVLFGWATWPRKGN